MILLKKYHVLNKGSEFYVISDEIINCPLCGGPLKVRDSKRRNMILSDGSVCVFHLRRLRCLICSALHLELPDCLLPHKHYARDVIERARTGSCFDCAAENSTIYRWRQYASEKESQ